MKMFFFLLTSERAEGGQRHPVVMEELVVDDRLLVDWERPELDAQQPVELVGHGWQLRLAEDQMGHYHP